MPSAASTKMTSAPTAMPAINPVESPDELEPEFELVVLGLELPLSAPPMVTSKPLEVLGDSVTVVEELEKEGLEGTPVVEELLVVFGREVVVVVP